MTIKELAVLLLKDFERNKRHIFTLANEFFGAKTSEEKQRLLAEKPETDDPRINALLASLAEWLSRLEGLEPPAWTKSVGPSPQAVYLVKAPRLSMQAFIHSPAVFRKRHIFINPKSFFK